METVQFRINKNLIIGILAFLAGAVLSYIVLTLIAGISKGPISDTNGNPTNQPSVSNQYTVTPSQTNPDENVFTSTILGLSFSYLKYGFSFDENDHGIIRSVTINPPKAEGNTITFGPNYASSMSVYDKLPTQSLEAAIKSQFLQDIPTTKCLPVRVVAGTEYAYYTPGNGISYVVLHPVVPNGCPAQFNFANPTAAFVSFSSQPNKFFYVIGEPDATMPLLTSKGDPFWVTMKFSN